MSTVALTVATKFTAQDKITAAVRKMSTATTKFTKKASAGFMMLQRQEKKLRNGFSKLTGKLGKLGLAFGGLMIATVIANANVELDASLASLNAIVGVTTEEFRGFQKEIDKVSESQKTFAGDTAKAFEIVGSAQPILLKNAKALSMVTEQAIILSKAGLMPIEDSAKALTGTMNQFDLKAEDSLRVINLFAAGAKEGSANIKLLSESFDKVGAVAKDSNLTLEQTGAVLELMSKFELKGSEAGISLKATLLRLKSASLGFASGQFNLNDALAEYNTKLNAIKDPIKRAAFEEKTFGKVHILTGKILTQNIGEINRLTSVMSNTSEATRQASVNSFTLKNLWAEIQNTFKNAVTSTDQENKALNQIKKTMLFVADNMGKIVSVVGKAIKIFAIYKIVMGVATAVQWAFNIAAMANPINWVVVGITALVLAIGLLIIKWRSIVEWVKTSDNVFAKLIRGALRPLVWIFGVIKKAWIGIRDAFKGGGFMEGIKQIGKTILSFLLAPMEAVLKVVNKLSGGKIGGGALTKISAFRDQLASGEQTEGTEPLNPDASIEKVRTERIEKTSNQNLNIGVKADSGSTAEILENSGVNVNLSNTLGWAGG